MNGDNALMLAMAYTDAQMEACGNVTIDDDSHTTGKTYSSEKIKELVDGKAAVAVNQTLSGNETALEELTIDGVKYRINNVPVFDTMPATEVLVAMSNNFIFETRGFYSKTDGHGGLYRISYYTGEGNGGLKIQDSPARYLTAIHTDKGRAYNYIDVCRYGVREYSNSEFSYDDITVESTYADTNSDIISRLYLSNYQIYLQFPIGRFFFQNPISKDYVGIRGNNTPYPSIDSVSSWGQSAGGTTLYFPFLTNGQTAISNKMANIENITVCGNPRTYRFKIDRKKTISDPENVITEVIGEEGTVKCTGISKTSNGYIRNVSVINFYTGINCSTANIYMENVYARSCHFGISVGNDTKLRGVYGWDVHTLLRIRGDITSAVQVRVDSCVNAVQIYGGKSVTLIDVDGDYCTDSLILIGGDERWATISSCVIIGIHGRCCALKSYNQNQGESPDVRTLADTSGYGVVRVDSKTTFSNNYILVNSPGKSCPFDKADDYTDALEYRTPNILFTFGASTTIARNQFVANGVTYISDADGIKKNIQMKSGATGRYDTWSGTFFIDGTTVNTYALAT